MKTFLLFLLVSQGAFASSIFSEETPIDITLSGNISSHIEHRALDQRYYGEVKVLINGKQYDGQIKVRGNARGKQCEIPPLKLLILQKNKYFKKSKLYKIVTHCNDAENDNQSNSLGSKTPIAGDNYLLKEYLTYKIQGLIMPNRFQVRLLRITYVDENQIIPQITRFAFVLERSKHVAKRLNGRYLDNLKVVDPEKLQIEPLVWASYFNLFIGNQVYLLWAKASHNFKFFDTSQGIVTVPYDFNLSELVNRQEDSQEMYYDMYAHNAQFPCHKVNEQLLRRIGNQFFLKKHGIFQYLQEA